MPGAAKLSLILAALAIPAGSRAIADTGNSPPAKSDRPAWAQHAAQEAKSLQSAGPVSPEPAPGVIPGFQQFRNPDGLAANYLPEGPVNMDNEPFFTSLGSNGRTCQSCHQPRNGWSITPSEIQTLFRKTGGTAPLFRPVDGAVCPSADTSSYESRLAAYSLVLAKGLIRVSVKLPDPPTLQFTITDVHDPYGCNTSAEFGLSSFGPSTPTQGNVVVYRRPLPATNLRFLTAIMWDGREATLESQATDATLIHAQAGTPPTQDQVNRIVGFENGVFSAQSIGQTTGSLTASGAQGGPEALSTQPFYVGINDPLGGNPTNTPFNPVVMMMFSAWELAAPGPDNASIARGEKIFNERPITITGVAGLNDSPGLATVNGFCTTCHDAPNVGNHSVKLPINIGVVAPSAVGLDTTGLPVFSIRCDAGPLAGTSFQVTDPGKALISGQCADIGKMKGPILRNLAARPPYFHNGAAPDLEHVVEFYDNRFGMGLSDGEKADLVAFLKSL